MRGIRKTKRPDDYHQLANDRGLLWLGPAVSNVMKKTNWRCHQGHEWKVPYSQIQKGRGCPACYRQKQRYQPDVYRNLAQERGFEWLGPPVTNVMKKTAWRCSRNHIWYAPYHHLRRGSGCPVCSKRSWRTNKAYSALARRRGFYWLGPNVANKTMFTNWACPQHHHWSASYQDVLNGATCPECEANSTRLKEHDSITLKLMIEAN